MKRQKDPNARGMKTGLSVVVAIVVCLAAATKADTVRVGLTGLPPAKGNPHFALIDYLGTWSAILDPLTLVTDDGDLLPWLATGWQQNSPTAWTITLRNDVAFSNGRPFEADAVVEAIKYLTSPQGRGDSVTRSLSFIKGAEVLDQHRIRIITSEPRPVLPYDLQLLRIVEPDSWQRTLRLDFTEVPIGTGPFAVDRWTSDEVSLSAVPTSWRAPLMDRLVLRTAPDSTSRLNGFLTDEFDIMTGVAPDMVPGIQAIGGAIRQLAVPGAMAIVLNTVKDPRFQDPRVRQALNYAVNKTAIIDILFAGLTTPASQPAPRMAVGYNGDIEPYPYDPARAKRLLAEAGYPNGLSFTLEGSNESSQNLNVYQQVAIDLAAVGVDMRIQPIPRPQYLEKFQQGSWTGSAFPLGYFSPSLDGLSILRGNSCLRPQTWFCDEDMVPLIEDAIAEPSLERRIHLTQQLMRAGHDMAMGLFLYEAVNLTALQPDVTGYQTHGLFVLYESVTKRP